MSHLAGRAADVTVGSDRATVLKEWGSPKSRVAFGSEETLTYDQNVRVYLKNGKVTGFRNRNLMSSRADEGSPANTATATRAAPESKMELTVPNLSNYKIPKPTILSEPNYRVRGSAGGESDGKTIGIDGKPLADHQQYANDSSEFLKLIRNGVGLAMPTADKSALQNLYGIHRATTPEKRKAQEQYYQKRYKRPATQDNWYGFAFYVESLDAALRQYQAQKGHLNHEERLRVTDRIDLARAPTPKGEERRREMKVAIWKMEQYRKILTARHGNIFNSARKAKSAEDARTAGAEKFATINKQDALMFLHTKFERTPMLEGLAQAAAGKIHAYAKPVLLPRGVKIQIVESRTVTAPAKGDREAMSLRVSRIRVKDPNVRQLDGAKLNMTLLGWILDSRLDPASN